MIFNLFTRDRTGAGLDSAESKFSKFQKAVKVGSIVAAGALVTAGKAAIDAASDYTEASNKADAVFKGSVGAIRKFEQISTDAYGISKKAALDYTGAMGAVLTASGVSEKAAAKLSVEYTKLAADLGSFNNTSTEEAAEALKASLTGEFEMMKKYGVVINDATLETEALRLGVEKAGATWSAAQKRQLSYSIVMRSTKDAQGDLARNTDTMAFKQRQLQARVEDMQVSLGQKLLPVYIKFLGLLQKAADWINQNQSTVKTLLIVLGSLWATVVAVSAATKAWNAVQAVARGATLAWAAAQRLLTMAMILSPIGAIVLLVAGLVAIVVLIAKKTNWFQTIWSKAWGLIKGAASAAFGWVKRNWPLILAILTGPIGLAVRLIKGNWDKIKAGAAGVKDWIVGKFGALVDFVKGMPGKIASAARGMFNGITSAFKSAINVIIRGWNSIQFSIPSFDPLGKFGPSVGGFTIGLPDIPLLAKGGNVMRGGSAVVGDAGPELLDLPRGARVTPLAGRNAAAAGAQRISIDVVVRTERGEVLKVVRKEVRTRGGNVQAVLGVS